MASRNTASVRSSTYEDILYVSELFKSRITSLIDDAWAAYRRENDALIAHAEQLQHKKAGRKWQPQLS